MKSYAIISLLAAFAAATNHEPMSAMSMEVMPAPSEAPAVAEAAPPPAEAAPPAAEAAPPGAGTIHTVTVGGVMPPAAAGEEPTPMLAFSPDNLHAVPGDIVRFNFLQKNHSVAQSTFDDPCAVMEGGAQSGFLPNPDGTHPPPTFDFHVKDTKPVWMYCQQMGHCGKGMVFAINPANSTGQPTDKSMENYKQLAISKYGMGLTPPALATTGAAPPAASETLTVNVGESSVASEATATELAPAAATASVVPGNGKDENGQTCACHCLCGVNAFPADVGVHQFGGFLGQMPPAPSVAGAAAYSGVTPAKRGIHHAAYMHKRSWN